MVFQLLTIIGKYYISSTSKKSIDQEQEDKMWIVVKSSQKKSLKKIPHEENKDFVAILNKGDVIKLGRVSFRITDLQFKGSSVIPKEKSSESIATYY